ncbi:Germin-like protein 9-1 [Hibiscus syriacus]|uniref:Germin-like protein n=1 Tax=Hibiscus syriacus TaxID=106335 RepID=A0A6A2WYX0_HIBSY|nr:Germin-like protein 9-1 [Hibiscus syriacus]
MWSKTVNVTLRTRIRVGYELGYYNVSIESDIAYLGFDEAYSFNGTNKLKNVKNTIFFNGLKGLEFLLAEKNGATPDDPRIPGKQQYEISFTKKNTPNITVREGDGFTLKVYFNGEECLLPDSVSFATLEYPAGTLNPPHIHPRAAELLIVIDGVLEVGFIDTTGKLYSQKFEFLDMFVFPKGLVHYKYNPSFDTPSMAVSAFGSANTGTVSVPSTVFSTGIDDNILAKGFKTDVPTIEKIKKGLGA